MGRQQHRKPDKRRNANDTAVKALAIVVFTLIAIVRRGPAYNDLFSNSSVGTTTAAAAAITATTTTTTPTTTSSSSMKEDNHTILVLYSGPATLGGDPNKAELYRRNFDFFLLHGVDCTRQDTIITLGHDVAPLYRERLSAMNLECRDRQPRPSHTITLVERDNECYDMESVRLVMHGNITNITDYDYFVYVNCGTTGPFTLPGATAGNSAATPGAGTLPPPPPPPHWTYKLIAPMIMMKEDGQPSNMSSSAPAIVMTGLSHVCEGHNTHVQSMVYALNKVGMQAIMESNCVYDCRPVKKKHVNMTDTVFQGTIINRYERGMGRRLLDMGYAISTLTRTKVLTKDNRLDCTDKDMWLTERMKELYGGDIPTLEQLMFFKTSRILTPETAKLINFNGTVWWNW